MPQPWRDDPGPLANPAADDFTQATRIMPVREAALVVAIMGLLLLAGRSSAIVDAVYGLPVLPGTEALIGAAELWDAAMARLGVADAVAWLRAMLTVGR